MNRDLRKFARQTNVQLIGGGLLGLFILGDGLILFFYGLPAAIFGLLCIILGLIPIVMIYPNSTSDIFCQQFHSGTVMIVTELT